MSVDQNQGAAQPEQDVIIIGGGIGGIYAVHRLRDQKNLTVKAFESASDLGGVWEWNRYPGARCDTDALQYSYSFSPEVEQEWIWSERFATQAEMLAYLKFVADRYDVPKDFQFNTTVTAVVWDDESGIWTVTTDDGKSHTARFVVSCVGALSAPKDIDIPGVDKFQGDVYKSFAWPREEVDLTGKRVALFGTGSTGVQIVTDIAEDVKELAVFQRTAGFALPAQNGPIPKEEYDHWLKNYRDLRVEERNSFGGFVVKLDPLPSAIDTPEEERNARYAEVVDNGGKFQLETFADILTNEESNKTAVDFIRGHIHSRVNDPEVADKLCPNDHAVGSKRLIYENFYFENFNRDNVHLVDIKNVPYEITETGVRTPDADYEFDVIIFATGFDAFTGALFNMGLVGRNGESLNERWKDGPLTHHGFTTHGFPNLFLISGPQSPIALYNNILAIEDHIDLSSDAIEYVLNNGYKTIEANTDAEIKWKTIVDDLLNKTLLPKAKSWYMGDNVPGKPRVPMLYMGGAPAYRKSCEEMIAKGYEGFTLS